jgi:ABC-type Mn2+/Zn2+ transport system permease subunit
VSWLWTSFRPEFMQRALVEIIVVSALAGVVGVHVSMRRLAFVAVAVSHATFPGVALAVMLGVSTLLGAGLFGIVVVGAIVLIGRRTAGSEATIDVTTSTGVVLAGSFAIGAVLVGGRGGFSRDLSSALIGSVLTVSVSDIVITSVVAGVVLAAVFLLHKELVFGAFDREGFRALGYRVALLDLLVLVVLEGTVVVLMPAVGAVLAVSMLVTPAATARLLVSRPGACMAVASGIAVVTGVLGLAIASRLGGAPGATIVLTQTAVFGLTAVAGWIRTRLSARRSEAAPGGSTSPAIAR